ncbi:hypothetical protein OAO87_04585 [bacterium]|nr:hypothetical protein [bacterium]
MTRDVDARMPRSPAEHSTQSHNGKHKTVNLNASQHNALASASGPPLRARDLREARPLEACVRDQAASKES